MLFFCREAASYLHRDSGLQFSATVFYCSCSSDGICLLGLVWFILFTVFTCLFQRFWNLMSIQRVNAGQRHSSKLKCVTFHFCLDATPTVSCFHSAKAAESIEFLVFKQFPFGSSAPSLRSFSFFQSGAEDCDEAWHWVKPSLLKGLPSGENKKRLKSVKMWLKGQRLVIQHIPPTDL